MDKILVIDRRQSSDEVKYERFMLGNLGISLSFSLREDILIKQL